MQKNERFTAILKMLESQNYISSEKLSSEFGVSIPTIRRDLAEMARQKTIVRYRGGAGCIPTDKIARPESVRETENAAAKKNMAKAAACLIHDNSVVFIDASSSCSYLPYYLGNKQNIIIITNGLSLGIQLKSLNFRVYCLGGEILNYSSATAGPISMEASNNFCIDIAFFSSYGINDCGVIVDPSEAETQLRRYIFEHTSKSVFLCDKSKFGRNSIFTLGHINKVDYFVTDSQDIPANYTPKNEIIIAG